MIPGLVSSGVVWLAAFCCLFLVPGAGAHTHVAQRSVGDWRHPDHSSGLAGVLSSSRLCPLLGHLASWNSDLSLEHGSDELPSPPHHHPPHAMVWKLSKE